MAIKLDKGARINLVKDDGHKLTEFCVGCNWGQIVKPSLWGLSKKAVDVDIDLSCVMFDASGNVCDHIYSPLYRPELLLRFGLPSGKLTSSCGALRHTGDDLSGDDGGADDGLDNEIITVNLNRISPSIHQIFFFLNICSPKEIDFSQIPYASIRMFEGTPEHVREVFASYNVAAEPRYANCRALILGKLYRHGDDWKFNAIGDPTDDSFVGTTIIRIMQSVKNNR